MRMTSALAVGIPSGGFRAGIPTPRPAADPLPRGTALKGRFARSLGPLRFALYTRFIVKARSNHCFGFHVSSE